MGIQDQKQTIVEHLSELRKRLIYSLVFLIGFSILSYRFSEFVVKDMISKAPDIEFVFIAPNELFMSYLKIAIVGGIACSLPVIIFNIWLFIKPGLEVHEKKLIVRSLFIGGILFFLGALFSYLIVLPLVINFFISFQIDEVEAMISFSNYLSFVITVVLSFGLVFELPIFMTIIVKLGLVSTRTLRKNRRFAILIIFILSAILTPPDVISQILLAIPMLLLFEVGIFFSQIIENNKSNNKK
ncbi:MAG TPA: twin-arginine translocase subunit TatC [Tissierellaceae bacterium]|nr:twin-arginine translocase subunit TatC [Tissierellaceae bacterium]